MKASWSFQTAITDCWCSIVDSDYSPRKVRNPRKAFAVTRKRQTPTTIRLNNVPSSALTEIHIGFAPFRFFRAFHGSIMNPSGERDIHGPSLVSSRADGDDPSPIIRNFLRLSSTIVS